MIVLRIDAYVDGRPMPSSSSALISDASVKRGGGCVKCWRGSSVMSRSVSPSVSSGIGRSVSSSTASFSSRLST